LVEINEHICQSRAVEENLTPQEKKRASGPPGGRAGSRPGVARGVQ
jgi:hypothetical protein